MSTFTKEKVMASGKCFKAIKWEGGSQWTKAGSEIASAIGFEEIYISFRDPDHWLLTMTIDTEFYCGWDNGTLHLSPSYTLDEVKDIAQAAWEHYIETNVYEKDNT